MRTTLVVNLGSSSVKYKLFKGRNEQAVSSGVIDRISTAPQARLDNTIMELPIHNHAEALEWLKAYFLNKRIIQNEQEVDTTIHRVVHGGEYFQEPVLVDNKILQKIRKLFPLSPLHNPINYAGIRTVQKLFPESRHAAVFDTAFYDSIPKKAYLYGIPYKYYQRYGIRKYGFHGISHRYMGTEVARIMKQKQLRHISCHLGNGSSITAIKNGKAIDTTMGFTPLQGLIMGTRSGSIDPAIIPFLEKKEKLSATRINTILNEQSGILGFSGISSDVRDIYTFVKQGDVRAKLTLDILSYQITQFIGQMIGILGGVDVISFTGGVGQNAFYIRSAALKPLNHMGIILDESKNRANKSVISASGSSTRVMVLATDEELEMFRESRDLL